LKVSRDCLQNGLLQHPKKKKKTFREKRQKDQLKHMALTRAASSLGKELWPLPIEGSATEVRLFLSQSFKMFSIVFLNCSIPFAPLFVLNVNLIFFTF
jgi:hypothetical protein